MTFAGDPRVRVAYAFLAGYFGIIFLLAYVEVPEKNLGMVENAILVLGPGVGLILAAIFRTDKADETKADNTGKAMDAMKAQADATVAAANAGTPTNGAAAAATQVAGAAVNEAAAIAGGAPPAEPPASEERT